MNEGTAMPFSLISYSNEYEPNTVIVFSESDRSKSTGLLHLKKAYALSMERLSPASTVLK